MKKNDHPVISSTGNRKIRDAAALYKNRDRSACGLIVIEGSREVERALRCRVEPVEAFYCPEAAGAGALAGILELLERTATPINRVTARVYEKLAYREGTEGVVLVAKRPRRAIEDLPDGGRPLYIVADGVEKPGNLGAIFRSADGAGATGIIMTGNGTDLFGPNVIRASLGTVFSVPSAESTAEETAAWLKTRGVRIVTSTPAATITYTGADLTGPTAMVVGSEDSGACERWLELSDVKVSIPMLGIADSLNVSVSASILVYEALRQRTARRAAITDA